MLKINTIKQDINDNILNLKYFYKQDHILGS